jgi:hypothetical protein
MFDTQAELGSNMSRSAYAFFVDVYAESGPLGRMLANDIRDLIKGRHGGRSYETFALYDFRTATPTQIDYLPVERVSVFKEDAITKPWQKHWYSVRFDVVDHYIND